MPAAVSSGGSFEEPDAPQGGALSLLSAEDRALVERLRAGDEPTFLAMVEKNHRAMVRVAMGYVASEAVAEEVVQEAWVGILQGLDKFEGRCPLRAWMFRILVNCAKMRGGREARSVPFSALETEDAEGERRPARAFVRRTIRAGQDTGRSAPNDGPTSGWPMPRRWSGIRGRDSEAPAEPTAGHHPQRHRGLGVGGGVRGVGNQRSQSAGAAAPRPDAASARRWPDGPRRSTP